MKYISKKNAAIILLTLFIFLGVFLRIYKIDTTPPGFFVDEASIGYNAYSILTTGKDEYGVEFPLFFRSLDDYKHPIPIYTSVPFIKMFGLNEVSTRLPSITYGALTILLLYLLGKALANRKVGLFAAFFGSIFPWLLHYNRTAFDYSAYAFFFLLSVYLFIKSIENKSYIIPAFTFFGLTIYTYQPAKLTSPLMLLCLAILSLPYLLKHKLKTAVGLLLFLIIMIPMIVGLLDSTGLQRLNQVSLYHKKELTLKEKVEISLSNYFAQLSPTIFLREEKTFITRHFIDGLNPGYLIMIPLSILGTLAAISSFRKFSSKTLLIWIVIYPVASIFVLEGPFTGRNIIGAPLLCLLAAIGVSKMTNLFASKLKRTLFLLSIVILSLLNLIKFMIFYTQEYPKQSYDFFGWQFGFKESMRKLNGSNNTYHELHITHRFSRGETLLNFYQIENPCKKCRIATNPISVDLEKKQLFALRQEDIDEAQNIYGYVFKEIDAVIAPDNKKEIFIGYFTE